jgi:hypothetical protein
MCSHILFSIIQSTVGMDTRFLFDFTDLFVRFLIALKIGERTPTQTVRSLHCISFQYSGGVLRGVSFALYVKKSVRLGAVTHIYESGVLGSRVLEFC